MGERLLTVRQVAARLAVSTDTVYRLCDRGSLRFVRISGSIRIDPASVEAFIAGGGDSSNQS
jgi:excisionase family DNA binding protein